MRDRALDLEQDLEQAVAFAQRGEQREALARPALALGAQRAFGLQRGDAAQSEPEDARHAQQQVALVSGEGVVEAGDEQPPGPVAVPAGDGHVAGPQPGQLERLAAAPRPDQLSRRGRGPEAGRGHESVADDHGADLGVELLRCQLGGRRGRALGALMRADGGQELDELMRRALRHQAIAHDVMPI